MDLSSKKVTDEEKVDLCSKYFKVDREPCKHYLINNKTNNILWSCMVHKKYEKWLLLSNRRSAML